MASNPHGFGPIMNKAYNPEGSAGCGVNPTNPVL